MGVTRRRFLISGAAVGGGLLLGAGGVGAYLQNHDRLKVQRDAYPDPNAAYVNLWIRITPDNRVMVINPHTDMGQGSGTGLLQIVADELDADWTQMQSETAPVDTAFSNGKVIEGFARDMVSLPSWGSLLFENGFYRIGDLMQMQMTGASTAVRFTGWEAMRGAAARARLMLISAAATELDVPVNTLHTARGEVIHADTGRSFTYGELASAAALMQNPDDVPLKAPDDYRYIGQSVPRIDIPEKVFANEDYGIDASIEGMQYAAVAPSGVFGAQVETIDNLQHVSAQRGVSHVLIVPDGVAVVADNPWRAEKAVRRVKFTRQRHANASLSTDTLIEIQRRALAGKVSSASSIGAPKDITATLSAEYRVPYLAHACMEPMNATVWQQDGKLHIVCGVQNPLLAKARAAEVAGLSLDDVVMHARQMGGGFGRRLALSSSGDEPLNWLVQAVRVHLDVGKPVKTTWSRETDIRADVYRPMVMAQFDGAIDDQGKPLLWRSRSYGKEMNLKAVAPPYDIPHVSVAFAKGSHPVPTGFWRSVEHSQHGFFIESFIDELAHAARADPLQYRLEVLADNSAAAQVIHQVATMSGWRHGVDDQGRAMGVAMVESFGSTVAQVVQVSRGTEGIVVHKVWCAVDCGLAINPGAVEAQIQGAIIFALSAALYGKCDIHSGAVVQSNFDDYRLVTMAQSPQIEVAFVQLGSSVGGVGEIGVPPLAPALANAIAIVDSERQRVLPVV